MDDEIFAPLLAGPQTSTVPFDLSAANIEDVDAIASTCCVFMMYVPEEEVGEVGVAPHHDTTEPSSMMTANPVLKLAILTALFPLKLVYTVELVANAPPAAAPHVITEPSDLIAANAVCEAVIRTMPVKSDASG
jgi:hypothetical protein